MRHHRHDSVTHPIASPCSGVAIFAAFAVAIVGGLASRVAESAEVVVVCPDAYREALGPWLDFRRQSGMTVEVCEPDLDGPRQRAVIAAAADRDTRYVVLVGESPVIGTRCRVERQVPTCYTESRVTVAWGSTPTIPADFGYSDLDGDGKPDAAVGRLPVSSAEELRALVDRILGYERSEDFGDWRGNVELTGGIGGFGELADTAIESVTRTVLTSLLPTETRTRVAYASPGHRFFPAGGSFTEEVLKRYREGARFWVYAGHGWVNQLDRVPRTDQGVPVLDANSVCELRREPGGSPIALILACYTGAIDAGEPCLAERMVLADGGPIAVFAGSRVTMPYGNVVTAVGLIDGVYGQRQPRIGDAWLRTLTELDADDDSADKSATRMMIDTLAALISPADTTLADERREHMRLYQLIGDPTLSLHQPEPLDLEVAETESGPVHGGLWIGAVPPPEVLAKRRPLTVRTTSPIDGELTVRVDRPLGAASDGDPNDTTVATIRLNVAADEPCESSIVLPRELKGPVIIRALVAGRRSWATAAATMHLR